MSVRKSAIILCLLMPLNAEAQERIDLESTFVGDKEQPSVSYFIPWKPPEGPSKLYRPIKSISGNVLDPIDREVLARNIQFYNELSLEGLDGRE
ncbi:MAG: hypothetical protein ABFS45_11940 [Pseudomonadota bacterium]